MNDETFMFTLAVTVLVSLLAIKLRRLEVRVESLYANHKSLSTKVYTPKESLKENEDG